MISGFDAEKSLGRAHSTNYQRSTSRGISAVGDKLSPHTTGTQTDKPKWRKKFRNENAKLHSRCSNIPWGAHVSFKRAPRERLIRSRCRHVGPSGLRRGRSMSSGVFLL